MPGDDNSDARRESQQADDETNGTVFDPRKPAVVRVVGEAEYLS